MAPILPLLMIAGAAGLYFLTQKGGGGSGTTPIPADDVKTAVQTALANETDSTKLNEFADSLLPDYPDYAQALHNKASQLTGTVPVNVGGGGNVPPPIIPIPVGPAPGPVPISPEPPPYVPPPILPPPAPLPQPVPVPNPPPTPHLDFPEEGSTAYVVTHDAGPTGTLNVRSGPGSSYPVVSKLEHGTGVTITGMVNANWYPVHTPLGIDGWASADYLGASPPADAPGGGSGGQELPIGPGGQGNEVISSS